jgi:microcystin-dependent protein
MNAAPDSPSAFKALVPTSTATLCGNFIKALLQLPALMYRLVNYQFDSEGNVSNSFRQQIYKPGRLIFSAALETDETDVLLCDGREVAKSDFPDLYAAIQDIYGTASSTSNFKIPDYRAVFPVGVGGFESGKTVSIGEKVGAEKVVLTKDQLPPHTHDVNGLFSCGLDRNANANGVTNNNSLSDASAFTLTSESTGGTGTPPVATGHDNIPPSIGVFVFVKV